MWCKQLCWTTGPAKFVRCQWQAMDPLMGIDLVQLVRSCSCWRERGGAKKRREKIKQNNGGPCDRNKAFFQSVFFCFLFKLIGQFSILEDHMLNSISKSDSYHWCWHKLAHSYHLQVPKTLVIRCCTYISNGKGKVTQPHFKCRIQVIAIHKMSGQGQHKRFSRKTPISTYSILPNSWMSLQSSVQYLGWSWHSIRALTSDSS
jgi:hypothetical protein